MGKTEAEVAEILEGVTEPVDFEGFKKLLEKKSMFDGMFKAAEKKPELTDDELKAKFEEFDKDKNGKLDKDELGKALKDLGKTDEEIEKEQGKLEEGGLDLEAFMKLVKPKSWMPEMKMPEMPK